MAVCFGAQSAFAQTQNSAFPDTPTNHWAYQAIEDLANRGLVKGYKDAKALNTRDLSRFEFATLIARVGDTLSDMVAVKTGAAPKDAKVPSAKVLTQTTLNEIVVLKDAFQDQLTAIQADVKKTQDDIDALRSDVTDAKDMANKALKQSDNSFGPGLNPDGSDSKRKFAVSGYIQARYIGAGSKNSTLFPTGNPTSNSGYNGNYLEGANNSTFQVRRSRLKVTGAVTNNTKFAIQLDAGGLTSGTNQAVTVREGNIVYTPGDGTSVNPQLTVGLFANPFGYALPQSSATIPWPERPLAFNENGEGLFANQDYDRGFQLSFAPAPQQMKYTLAFVNGSGRGSNDTDRRIDTIVRAAYTSVDKTWGVGASYYTGDISFSGAAPIVQREKKLFGVDAQYRGRSGLFALAEYVGGTFEQRTWMDVPTVKLTTAAAPGNKVQGYYGTLGFNFNTDTPHPWALMTSYDVFRRSSSGATDSGSTWDDKNWSVGGTYNFDPLTRFRLWFTNPTAVAHPSTNPSPKKVGLVTAEIQVRF